MRKWILGAGAALTLVAVPTLLTAQSADDFEWRGRIDAGDALEIKGVNGPIRATRAAGAEVEVIVRKSARRSDPDEVSVEVLEHAGGVTLCALYPTPERADRPNVCGVGDEGRMSVNRNDVTVEWEIRLPAGVRLDANTVNGGIVLRGLDADVEASTVNGGIEIETTGTARARTVNGDIEARFMRLSADADFETVNGSIDLDLDDDIDADLDAGWVNGNFDTDLPLSMRGRIDRRSARGELGEGGAELRLRTVNGSIRIR